jgi:hypothetical protein
VQQLTYLAAGIVLTMLVLLVGVLIGVRVGPMIAPGDGPGVTVSFPFERDQVLSVNGEPMDTPTFSLRPGATRCGSAARPPGAAPRRGHRARRRHPRDRASAAGKLRRCKALSAGAGLERHRPRPRPWATPPRGPSGAGDLLLAMVQGLRPKQWAKNVFVLAAILFSMNFGRADMWVKVLAAFATFSMFSSAGYLFNDASDVEADRKHPTKRKRAIASGRLPLPVAYARWWACSSSVARWAGWVSPWLVLIASLYLVTTLSYSFYFKHVVILDVMFISAGFLWRAAAGAGGDRRGHLTVVDDLHGLRLAVLRLQQAPG